MKATVGEAIPDWSLDRVSPERMRTAAAIFRDPNPIHWDPEFARERGLEGGRVVNQTPLNVAYVVNMLIAWAGSTCIRRLRLEFPAPVFDEDRVVAGGRVKTVSSERGIELAECDVWLDRDDGTRAVAGVALVALPESGPSDVAR